MNQNKNISVQVVGSINMDMIVQLDRFPKEGETLTGTKFMTAPGGKGANQAVAASRLGAKTALIGCVGVDQFGKDLVGNLKKEKVSMRRVGFIPDVSTGTAIISINTQAQNQIIVIPGANHTITLEHLKRSWKTLKMKPQAVLLQLEISFPIVWEAAQIAKRDKALVVLNPAPAYPITRDLLQLVDYLVPNEHEAKLIAKKEDVEDAATTLHKMGAKHVVITLGEKGALYTNGQSLHYVPSFRVHAIDPTAAGDTFVAAFTVAILEGKSPLAAIQFANAAGALATTKMGAQPSLPTRVEIEQFLKQKNLKNFL